MRLGITTPIFTMTPDGHAPWEAEAQLEDVVPLVEAADCLGLTRLQTIVHVVLLPAMERVYPALSSQFVLLMLASSITSQISAEELTATANLVQSDTYRSFEVYVIVAVVYLALSALYRLGFWAIGLILFERRRRLGTPL